MLFVLLLPFMSGINRHWSHTIYSYSSSKFKKLEDFHLHFTAPILGYLWIMEIWMYAKYFKLKSSVLLALEFQRFFFLSYLYLSCASWFYTYEKEFFAANYCLFLLPIYLHILFVALILSILRTKPLIAWFTSKL